ncbi:hypothetical protein GIB67_025625 [Kingdonia uniflora]|uniref:GRF-type domain-containing protein n=1 Tax=Kingdonia uniflora TaxID=39325 RepID=A0A7J7L8D0_9MAGN|nr:hypothetical protein GIB67_025625 [Kingdonia uniflora]
MAQVGPPCTCGAGYMRRYRANTKNNNGRYFYRCPQFKNQCKSFIWENVLVGGLQAGDLEQGGEQVDEKKQVEIMRPRIWDNNYLTYAFIGWDSNVEDVVESAIEELGEELSLLDVGQFSHGVNDVEESPESASNGGNGPSGSGARVECVKTRTLVAVVFALENVGRTIEAEAVFEEIKEGTLKPRTRAYNALLKGYVNTGSLRDVESIATEMEKGEVL